MTRKLLIIFFAALFFIGIIYSFNRVPDVEVGKISVFYNSSETFIDGDEVAKRKKDTLKTYDVNTDILSIKDSIKCFEQNIVKNESEDSVEISTDMLVSYYGRAYSSTYSIYDLDGNILQQNAEKLNLPTNDISGCIVKVDVKWGRENNYREFIYFFRVNYNKQ